jgi:MFS family permease
MSASRSGESGDEAPLGEVLRSNGAFRLLWSSRTISVFGDSLSLVALLLYIAGSTDQAFAVAALLLVGDFAPSLLGPLTGLISDRFDLRRIMVVCELMQAAAVVVIVLFLPPLPVLLALVALRATAGQIFLPASRAAVPLLVADRQLESANSAVGFGSNGMEAAGPLIAAASLPLLGVRGVLLVDVATFLVSAVLLGLLPQLPAVESKGARTAVLTDAIAGLRYVLTAPLIRAVVLGFTAVVAFNGVDDVALIFLARDTLHAGGSAVALLYGAVGIGLLVGYALLRRRPQRFSLVALAVAGFAISSLGNLLTGVAWAIAVAFAVQLLRGVGLSAIDVGVNTFLQRQVSAGMRGRVFGNLYAGIGAAAAASYLLGALLLELTDPRTTFIVAGGGGLGATVATAAAASRAHRGGLDRLNDHTSAEPPTV